MRLTLCVKGEFEMKVRIDLHDGGQINIDLSQEDSERIIADTRREKTDNILVFHIHNGLIFKEVTPKDRPRWVDVKAGKRP